MSSRTISVTFSKCFLTQNADLHSCTISAAGEGEPWDRGDGESGRLAGDEFAVQLPGPPAGAECWPGAAGAAPGHLLLGHPACLHLLSGAALPGLYCFSKGADYLAFL